MTVCDYVREGRRHSGTDNLLDDELWNAAVTDDEFLGLDHVDRTRSLRNGVGDLFLK
jgi:hypothetical protein